VKSTGSAEVPQRDDLSRLAGTAGDNIWVIIPQSPGTPGPRMYNYYPDRGPKIYPLPAAGRGVQTILNIFQYIITKSPQFLTCWHGRCSATDCTIHHAPIIHPRREIY
jgi:hypothetical protein